MAITKIWAANGIKSPIPATPQGDNLVNYDEGFTTPYRTPIKDGGVPIGMGTFNQLMFDITDEIIEAINQLNAMENIEFSMCIFNCNLLGCLCWFIIVLCLCCFFKTIRILVI